MAFVLCPKHGGHGAAAVCSHLAAQIVTNQPIQEALVPVSAVYEGTTLGPTWLCPACATRFDVPSCGATFEGDEGLERYWSEIGFTPVCPRCFEISRAAAD